MGVAKGVVLAICVMLKICVKFLSSCLNSGQQKNIDIHGQHHWHDASIKSKDKRHENVNTTFEAHLKNGSSCF